jgi:hypothetical protein
MEDQSAHMAAALSAVRTILAAIGAVLVTKGVTDQNTLNQVIGAIITLVPLVWGVVDKYLTELTTQRRVSDAVTAATATPTITMGVNKS